jgi:hypothetical protein
MAGLIGKHHVSTDIRTEAEKQSSMKTSIRQPHIHT